MGAAPVPEPAGARIAVPAADFRPHLGVRIDADGEDVVVELRDSRRWHNVYGLPHRRARTPSPGSAKDGRTGYPGPGDSRSLPHGSALREGSYDSGLEERVGFRGEGVAVEDDEVGQQSQPDGAHCALRAARPHGIAVPWTTASGSGSAKCGR